MTLRRICFWILFSLCCARPASAQGLNKPADLAEAFQSSPRLILGFDSRRSFISRRDVRIFGVRAGLNFDDKARAGWGIYFLASPFRRTFEVPNPATMELDTIDSQLSFVYMSVWFEYVLLTTKRWELSAPLHLGLGTIDFPGVPNLSGTNVLLTELVAQGHYKIFPFVGLGAGVGFRKILLGGQSIRNNFDAPIYKFSVKVWLSWFVDKIRGTI